MNFYLTKNSQKLGPYSVEQLRIFLQQGLVTTADEVWADGWPSWMPIGNVPGLVGSLESANKPPQPSSTNYAPSTVYEQPRYQQPGGLQYAEGKNPVIACVLSLAIVGAGQFYNGDWSKGWCLLVTCIVCSFFSLGMAWFVWAAFSALDAYRVADRAKPLHKMLPL